MIEVHLGVHPIGGHDKDASKAIMSGKNNCYASNIMAWLYNEIVEIQVILY